MIDQSEIELMVRAAAAQREREAPRTKRELGNSVTITVALMLASAWERRYDDPAFPSGRGYSGEGQFPPPVETPKSRVIRLFERDPLFYHTVRACESRIMVMVDDYLRLRTG